MFQWGNGKTFADRQEAGIALGKLLERDYKDKNVLVLGIPRGGVEVAYYVAQSIHGDLSVIISKKLPYPGQEELAFGAVAEDGSVYFTSLASRIDKDRIDKIISQQVEEIHRRVMEYRHGESLPEMEGRIVIIVDDGIATGSTLVPILKLCRAKKATKVIVAAPVSGERYAAAIDELSDEVIVCEIPEDFYAVGQVYDDFHGLSDTEVMDILQQYEKSRKTP